MRSGDSALGLLRTLSAPNSYGAAAEATNHPLPVPFARSLGAFTAVRGTIGTARVQIRATVRAIDLGAARCEKDPVTRFLLAATHATGVRTAQVLNGDMHHRIQEVCEPVGNRPTSAVFQSIRVNFHMPVRVTITKPAAIGHGRERFRNLVN
jgi:hypothetical protein